MQTAITVIIYKSETMTTFCCRARQYLTYRYNCYPTWWECVFFLQNVHANIACALQAAAD
jgi:hypothetical protein